MKNVPILLLIFSICMCENKHLIDDLYYFSCKIFFILLFFIPLSISVTYQWVKYPRKR